MRVLASPVTWIALAAVLAVVALLLFLLAALRHRRATQAAAGPPPATEPAVGERAGTPATTPPGANEPATAPIDVDALRARLAAEARVPSGPVGERRRPRHAANDEPDRAAEQAPDLGSAKDRLLAVLLHDPRGAVDALAADRGTGPSAAALLRAGLTPAQVAQLVGVEERLLATVVARELGLLGPGQGSVGATGENRTDDPGRSWANTASSAGSTTPTTG